MAPAYGLCQIYDNESWHYELRPEAIDRGCPPMYADPTHDPRMQRLRPALTAVRASATPMTPPGPWREQADVILVSNRGRGSRTDEVATPPGDEEFVVLMPTFMAWR